MRILVVHNAYQQRGGEDVVADAEAAMLREAGHTVLEYRRHNDELLHIPQAQALADTIWSRRTTNEVGVLIEREQPDVMHVHNTFPLISPSVYWTAHRCGVPVVQTLHNFRLLCPQATLLREGKPCEDCVGRVPWRGVLHGCYRGSRTQTLGVAASVGMHRLAGTWETKISRYIALNEFCRAKFVAAGLPADRVVVKPNFVNDVARNTEPREGFIFVGRLSPEKGVSTLAAAAKLVPDISITIVGDGPEAAFLKDLPNVRCVGHLSSTEVIARISGAAALLLPSVCFESFPRTLAEAYACGTPVIASRLGALPELVTEGINGLMFSPGDAADLARVIRWASEHREPLASLGDACRLTFEQRYTKAINLARLEQIYRDAASHPIEMR